jgi:ribosome-associated translation inhibitor RaiA
VQVDFRLKGVTLRRVLREQVGDHLDAAFRRLSKRIHAVTVCLANANGSRGNVDKNCQIAVQLHRGGTIRRGCTDADLIAAINLATDRVIHAVVRRLERRRKRAARIRAWTPCED